MTYKFILLVMLFAGLVGCGTISESVKDTTTITDRTIAVQPPIIQDTLRTRTVRDTVYAEKIVKGDTVLRVIYTPKKELITVWAKPDSVYVSVHDTLRVIDTVKTKDDPWYVKVWDVINSFPVGFLACLALMILTKINKLITF